MPKKLTAPQTVAALKKNPKFSNPKIQKDGTVTVQWKGMKF